MYNFKKTNVLQNKGASTGKAKSSKSSKSSKSKAKGVRAKKK